MTGQIVIQSSPAANDRRQPLLLPRENSIKVGELAGSAAAECAAICCCCPCALVGCLVLAVYKVPVGICRRIWRKRLLTKRRKKKSKEIGLLCGVDGSSRGGGSSTVHCFKDSAPDITTKGFESVKVSIDGSAEVVDLDREMWEQFRNTGFWRSPSQRFL